MKLIKPLATTYSNSYQVIQTSPIDMTTAGTNPSAGTPGTAGGFRAVLTQAPADGATISGLVTFSISGNGIKNVELLPETGYSPKYATFSIAPDGTSASVTFNTQNITDRTQKFRISAFDTAPGVAGNEIVVITRTWKIQNGAAPTNVAIEIDYFGDGTIIGTYLATPPSTYGTASPTAVQTFASNLSPQYNPTVHNRGIAAQGTRRLLQHSSDPDTTVINYGGVGSFNSILASSTASICIVNTLLNDADSFQENNTTSVYDANLREIVSIARSHNKTIIFEKPNPCNNFTISAYLTVMENVASAFNVPIIDQYTMLTDYITANSLAITDICPDGEFPTPAIYTKKGQYAATRFKEIMGVATPTTTAPDGVPAIAGPDSTLFNATPTFFDGFDGTTLTSKWNQGPWYQSAGNPTGTLRINGGCLEMCGQSASIFTGTDNTAYCYIDTDPVSGKGASAGFVQKFGVWQIEAKLPVGAGYWPAFWLFNHVGAHRPEIDIFEAYPGGSGDWSSGTNSNHPNRIDVSLHPADDPGGEQATAPSHTTSVGTDLSAAFHIYTIEWDSAFMKFYIDGVLKWTMSTSDTLAFMNQNPLYLILDLGINYSTAGGPSSNTTITPVGFGSDPNSVPANVYRIKYACAWQYSKYL